MKEQTERERSRSGPSNFSWFSASRAYVVFLLCAATAIVSQAQTFTIIANFNGINGSGPEAMLVQGTDGNFYGTTRDGGANDAGTVFKVAPDGTLTALYSFGSTSTDGRYPAAGLVQGTDGNLYGTTYNGGAKVDGTPSGGGTVFEIDPGGGTLTTLYSFCSQPNCADGLDPKGTLVQGADGNFYGTTFGTSFGGAGTQGTVFKITPGGALTTLHSFCSQLNCADGETPQAGLVQGTDGNFYGTTSGGGGQNIANETEDGGTIFKITPTGALTTLYSFCYQIICADGSNPWAGLVRGADGNFYGTTPSGGANHEGTVFKITPGGTLTTLYNFCSQLNCADGSNPQPGARLTQGTDGNFYGTTGGGGANEAGTAFKITPAGTLTTLYSFGSASTEGSSHTRGSFRDRTETSMGRHKSGELVSTSGRCSC
jgi:uncharacterized repeat protein (TIGR03803 family)